MASKTIKGYVGWALSDAERTRLLDVFPPKFDRVIAHHVTLQFGVTSDVLLPEDHTGIVVAQAIDPEGVQALVLRIGGTTRRPSGGTHHVTWSLAEGRRPVESNWVIDRFEWQPTEPEIVQLIPTFFPF
jgi:hypothetical protein